LTICDQERWRIGTSKHGDTVNVVEFTIAFFIESSPDVGHKDLWSFHDANSTLFEFGFIAEACKVVSKEVDEFAGTVVGCFDEVGNAAIKFLYELIKRSHRMEESLHSRGLDQLRADTESFPVVKVFPPRSKNGRCMQASHLDILFHRHRRKEL
jgi:hypothetical protein